MSLPSQSGRTNARTSSVNYRRSRANPLRKAFPALFVVVGLGLILWFALIRPSDPSTDLASGDSPAEQSSTTSEKPVVISNASPSRALPGSGERPDTQREVEDTIASSTPATDTIRRNTESRNNAASQNPAATTTNSSVTDPISSALTNTGRNQNDPGSLLDATRNQPAAQQPTLQPNDPISAPQSGVDRVRLQLDTAQRMVAQNDRVAARLLLSQTLNNPKISVQDAEALRDALRAINEVLVFGPVVAPNDPMCEEYKIQSGDSLSRIASRRELATHWKLIQRVNRIANPSRIRLGQTLKLVRGPFHAIVHKHEHRMDIYHGAPSDPAGWVYITSFNVGLGADNGTPIGVFTVSNNKLENPGWVNPRDASERYAPDDPRNPIGEYWLGLDGVGEYSSLNGYGIHGTINPESIGGDQSMGCVRLADADIALVYELLVERASIVEIRP